MTIARTPSPTPHKPTSQIQIFDPPKHPALAASYSQISTVPLSASTTLVTIAGQVGHDYNNPAGSIPASFPEQIRLALRNIETCLAAAGATKRDIVGARQYVVRMSQLHAGDVRLREDIVAKWWGKDRAGLKPPPDTVVGVESLAPTGGKREYLFEMEVTAVVGREEEGKADGKAKGRR